MEENKHHTEPELSPTKPESKAGRPRKSRDVPQWTIRGVEPETRTAIEKASTRSSKTMGQYFNEDIRHFVQEQLKKGNNPPMLQEDIRSELDNLNSKFDQLLERLPSNKKQGILSRFFK
jgi:hypothetical protein